MWRFQFSEAERIFRTKQTLKDGYLRHEGTFALVLFAFIKSPVCSDVLIGCASVITSVDVTVSSRISNEEGNAYVNLSSILLKRQQLVTCRRQHFVH
jgi:hypothetical protein